MPFFIAFKRGGGTVEKVNLQLINIIIMSVFKAVDITQAEDGLVVQFENVPLDEAFTNIDMQGGIDVDLATVQAYSDDVELHYIVGGTEEKNGKTVRSRHAGRSRQP